eukprot:scaffold6438_cov129-Isochrysis_galbana.AAC.2
MNVGAVRRSVVRARARALSTAAPIAPPHTAQQQHSAPPPSSPSSLCACHCALTLPPPGPACPQAACCRIRIAKFISSVDQM